MRRYILAGLLLCGMACAVSGEDKPKPKAEPVEIPYRLTVPKHIMIRAKINNKGPFNFILDTGAPALFLATSVGDKLGIKADPKTGWATFERFEIEGGLVIENAKGIIQTPFQLEGMNGMGLAGAELHGMIGYNLIARYRMEIDFTKDKMVWTPLNWEPELPFRASQGAVIGVELADDKNAARIKGVVAGGPAKKAGILAGDRIVKVLGQKVGNFDDLKRVLGGVRAGDKVDVTVERGTDTKVISVKTEAAGGGGGASSLEMMGGIMKTLGGMMGRKANPDYVLRPNLGVELADEKNEVVRVLSVHTDGPAHKAGLQKQDVIAKVKGRTVTNIADIQRHLGKTKKGEKIELSIDRGGEKKTITLEAGEGL